MPNKIYLNSNQITEIINLYNEGYSTVIIGNKFGFSYNFIRKILKEQGIQVRNPEERARKITINKYYFDNIDSEDKAYFLGFLFSDGCNHTNNGRYEVRLTLNKKDIDIITKFSNFVYGKSNLLSSKDIVSCVIHSKHMSQVLESYGCTPRKSLTLQFPTCVPDHLLHHFMRGYFDGDGCIYLGRQGAKIDPRITIVSTMDFCKGYQQALLDRANLTSNIHRDKRDIARGNLVTSILMLGGNKKIPKLYHFLYKDATYYLERKRDKFLQLKL